MRLWKAVRSHDLVFGWFASWHTFLPLLFARLQNKPSILVMGGYDVANLPQIGYGHQRGGLPRLLSRWTMRLATQLIANSAFSRNEAQQNAGIPEHAIRVIPHGIPDRGFSIADREHIALTVGNVSRSNLFRKGLEPFVRTAALLPGVRFIVAGKWLDDAVEHLRAISTPNVSFSGQLDEAALLTQYSRASVYVQASLHEGFGMSLAEAMLAGCIPVVTRAGAIPEVTGDICIYAKSTAPADLAEAVRTGLAQPPDLRQRARNRIAREFPLQRRRDAFAQTIQSLLE